MKRTVKEIPAKKNSLILPAKLKVCAYVRVSTEHPGQMGSLQNQTEYYEKKLKANPEYEFCGIFSDAGISGGKSERPGFQEMLKKAKDKELDLIVTKSISRFARNTLTLLQTVRELKEAGVGILFEEQNIYTLSSEGELMLTVLGAMAEEERKAVCANVQWAMQKKFKRGEVLVDANRLLGYDKDEKGNLVINEEQAGIVRRIYKLYLDGIAAYKIAQDFNEEKVPTYSDKPWSSHRILRIISNEKNAGDCLMQKAYVNEEGREVLNRGERTMYYVKDDHPAIVTRKDWQKAQRLREARKRKTYPLSGKLHCAYCGAILIRVIHQKQWVTWICANYLHRGKGCCIGMRIRESTLQELVKKHPVNEPMVLEEVSHGQSSAQRSQKNYCLVPAAGYRGFAKK